MGHLSLLSLNRKKVLVPLHVLTRGYGVRDISLGWLQSSYIYVFCFFLQIAILAYSDF